MDPLDDLFAALRVRSALMARIEGRGAWGLAKTGGETARYGLVARGRCLLEMEGQARPVQLEQGDCFLVPHGTPYVLRDAPWTPPVSCRSVTPDARSAVVELGTGSGMGAVLLCGWFHFEAEAMRPLAHLLPPLLHVKMDSARAEAMQGTLQLLTMETLQPGMGSGLVLVGDDFRFGARRAGDFDLLAAMGPALGFEVVRMPSFELDGLRVSSSGLRDALLGGDMDTVRNYLGRPYCISGHVVHGRKLGRDLGFPTLNLRFAQGQPAAGGIFVSRSSSRRASRCASSDMPTDSIFSRSSASSWLFSSPSPSSFWIAFSCSRR